MISVSDLHYTYPGAESPTLKDLNFNIDKGEIFGFLGPSGAGKSTCQQILYKIINNFEGNIEVNGKELTQWGQEYFENIGVGFELPNHYGKLSARENLELFSAFYPKNKRQDILPLLAMVGLEQDVNKPVDSYSKGMKMRLNFVRAIMHQPDILFFDEPTSGLDPVNAHIIKNHIQELSKQGKTIFITTHDMATADELCNRISLIVDGEIVVTEKPSELKLQHGKNLVNVELKNGSSSEFPLTQLGTNPEFIKFIGSDEVLRIHTQEASLEQVFIKVTGEALTQ